MKNTLRYFVVVIASFALGLPWSYGQGSTPKYEVTGTPICWQISGKDSNLVRYTLLSPSSGQPKSLFYVNALGVAINPIGGLLKMGWCCDCGGGSDFTPLAANGLRMDGDSTQLGGGLNENTVVLLNRKSMLWAGDRFGEGIISDDNIDYYRIGTGTGSTTQDAYGLFYRDIDGLGRAVIAANTVLIGVPAGNGYYLPNIRPGGNPSSFPNGTKWFPSYDRSGSGTGTTAGWYQVPQERTGTITATTDANGDILVTFGSDMFDTSYIANATPVSATRYAISVHSKTISGFKINAAAGAGTSVTIDYLAKDF